MSKKGFDQNENIFIKTKSILAKMQLNNTVLSTHYNISWFFYSKKFEILFL